MIPVATQQSREALRFAAQLDSADSIVPAFPEAGQVSLLTLHVCTVTMTRNTNGLEMP